MPDAYKRYLVNSLRGDVRSAGHADPADAARKEESVCCRVEEALRPRRRLRGPTLGKRRRAAFIFIFITVLLDMLAIGIIMPVLPKLVVDFVGGEHRAAAEILGVFGTVWALMQFLFSPVQGDRCPIDFGRRPVILASNVGLGLDYMLMALAPTLSVAVRRARHLRHRRRQHLDRLCLYRRRHRAGGARASRWSA